jgi:hypothetical protein
LNTKIGRDTALFGMIAVPSSSLNRITAWATGMRYALPRDTTRSSLKVNVQHNGRGSLAIDNSDLPFARLGFSIGTPIFDAAPTYRLAPGSSSGIDLSSNRTTMGFSVTFGDCREDEDSNDDGSSPALAPATSPCPHCIV